MLTGAYVIFDRAVEAYHIPFFARTDLEAKRMIAHTSKDVQSKFHQHPEDYNLFKIGTFDDQDGMIKKESSFKNLGNIITITVDSFRGQTLAQILKDQVEPDLLGSEDEVLDLKEEGEKALQGK